MGSHRRGMSKTNDSHIIYYFCKKKKHMKKDCTKWRTKNKLVATYQMGQLGNFGETSLVEEDCSD